MKRINFIRILEENGWYFAREGSNHTIYTNGLREEAVGRHKELDDELVKKILKRNGIEWRKK
jgi:predicted RNA binding protein YcfA (HicA-like mRNA interferase family)